MKENKVIKITMILNFIVAIIKLTTGIVFNFSTLIADSIQSFIDFITDITSLIANKIGKRRANKNYPFGYGQIYYVSNLITGLLLFLIRIFIIYQIFYIHSNLKPTKSLFCIIGVIIFLKLIVVNLLRHYGTKYKSELMKEASKESYADLVSTIVVFVVAVLVSFEKYIPIKIDIDKIGSIGMAIYVFVTSLKMIVLNIKGLMTNTEENTEIKDDVLEELEKFKELTLKNIKIIKMSSYYHIYLKLKVNEKMSMKEYLTLEKQVKKHLKNKNREIRFIDIEPV